jgi:hypothetical protein
MQASGRKNQQVLVVWSPGIVGPHPGEGVGVAAGAGVAGLI